MLFICCCPGSTILHDLTLLCYAQASAYALNDAAVADVLLAYERGRNAEHQEHFSYLQLLSHSTEHSARRLGPGWKYFLDADGDVLPADLQVLAKALGEPCSVVVVAGTVEAMRADHRRLVVHSLSAQQFYAAQFSHPEVLAQYHVIFVRLGPCALWRPQCVLLRSMQFVQDA